jgi:hypothetical protein
MVDSPRPAALGTNRPDRHLRPARRWATAEEHVRVGPNAETQAASRRPPPHRTPLAASRGTVRTWRSRPPGSECAAVRHPGTERSNSRAAVSRPGLARAADRSAEGGIAGRLHHVRWLRPAVRPRVAARRGAVGKVAGSTAGDLAAGGRRIMPGRLGSMSHASHTSATSDRLAPSKGSARGAGLPQRGHVWPLSIQLADKLLPYARIWWRGWGDR